MAVSPPVTSPLTLQERRSVATCELYSCRLGRTVTVTAATYWFVLWLDWAPTVAAFIERPSAGKRKPLLADFWLVEAGAGRDGRLLNARFEGEVPKRARAPSELWSLDAGLESQSGQPACAGLDWHWTRRQALLNLEHAQPFAVAAKVQGGVQAASRAVSRALERGADSIGSLLSASGGEEAASLRAFFALVKDGRIAVDWGKPLTRNTAVEATGRA